MTQVLESSVIQTELPLHENEVRFYQQEGYLYMPGLLSPETARTMREETLEIMDVVHGASLARLRKGLTEKDKLRQSSEYLVGSTIDSVVNSPQLLAMMAQLLGGEATLYLPFTSVKNGGGGGRFHFHQDNQYTRFTNGLLGLNCWIALDDMSPANGCLQVVPRSHLRGQAEATVLDDGHRSVKIEPENFLPVRMRAGDAIIFTRLTVHGSGPNTTGEPRTAYAIQFHRNDVEAVWDNQPPRSLIGQRRWVTGPRETLTRATRDTNLDGH